MAVGINTQSTSVLEASWRLRSGNCRSRNFRLRGTCRPPLGCPGEFGGETLWEVSSVTCGAKLSSAVICGCGLAAVWSTNEANDVQYTLSCLSRPAATSSGAIPTNGHTDYNLRQPPTMYWPTGNGLSINTPASGARSSSLSPHGKLPFSGSERDLRGQNSQPGPETQVPPLAAAA